MHLTQPIAFDVQLLGRALREACPGIAFALLHGSARSGTISPGSDLDIAVFCGDPVSARLLLDV